MATSLILDDEKKNLFRILAYKKAAETIASLDQELYDLWKEKKIQGLPGIGKGITLLLEEFFKTGHMKDVEKQINKYEESVYFLQNIRGIGPKTALVLSKLLSKNNNSNLHFYGNENQVNKEKNEKIIIDKLIQLCKEHKIANLEGFGEKSENDILNSVLKFQEGIKKDRRINLAEATPVAEKFVEYLKNCKAVKNIEVLGSLRRRMETVGDIDIAVSSDNPEEVIKFFVEYKYARNKEQEGESKAAIQMNSGTHVDLRVISPNQWGTMLAHFTGSKEHNIALRELANKKGMSISEWGIKLNQKPKAKDFKYKSKTTNGNVFFKTEEDFYKFLGLQYIPPELRENTGEIEAALKHSLPKLIELKDIKGDLHMHTNFNVEPSHDLGQNTPEEMVERAVKLGRKYIAFSEHNPSISKHNKSQISEILKKKKEMVDKLNQKYQSKIHIFNSLEVDILPDGNLAIEEEHLKYLDFIIASIHSSFEQTKEKQTQRILRALAFPKVKIFGHPTGRLVEKRESIMFDHDAVFKECLRRRVALEISASPYRNDLNWRLIKDLSKFDLKYIINTDSHSAKEMDLMKFGVWNARKGWLEVNSVINTWSLSEIKKFLLK